MFISRIMLRFSTGRTAILPFFSSSRHTLLARMETPKSRRIRSFIVAMLSISSTTLKSLMLMLLLSRWATNRLRVLESGKRRIMRSFFSSLSVTMLRFANGWFTDTASTR